MRARQERKNREMRRNITLSGRFLNSKCYWFLITIIAVIMIYLLVSNLTINRQENNNIKCEINHQINAPILYNLHTKLGVSYRGSHWFHMAENFMAYHSTYTNSQTDMCNSNNKYIDIIYNFDKGK